MKKGLIGLALAMLLMPFVAYAADFKTDETTATVGKSETANNLYIGSQTVNVDGNVSKDLVAGGGNVNVNGNVEGSVLAAGGNITIKGNIGNNIRTAGSIITIEGNVGGDITSIGSTVTISKNSVINGDVMFAGSTLTIDGTVNGNVYFSGAKALVNGTVKGNVNANLATLTIGTNGSINGKLSYWSNKPSDFDSSKVAGGVEFHKVTESQFDFKGFWYFGLIMKTLTILIILLLLSFLMPRFAKNFSSETYKNIWKNLGWGAFTLFVVPIVLVLLMITLFGIPIAVVLGLILILMLIAAGILVPLVVGSLIWKLIRRSKEYEADWKVVLIGVAATFVMSLIPVIGWLVLFVFYIFSLGEVSMTIWGVLRKQKA